MFRILRTRCPRLLLLAIAFATADSILAIGESPTGAGVAATGRSLISGHDATPDADEPPALIREGTRLLDRRGHFEFTGDSAVFVDENGTRLSGLQNLNMQRVNETLRAARVPEDLTWTVSGVVTEFMGQNFLLISRVFRRSSVPKRVDPDARRARRSAAANRTVVDTGAALPTMGSTGK